jgi:RimJ/RimL family protein N-acetyltransferase
VAEEGWEAGTDFGFLLLDSGETELLGIFGLHRRIGPAGIELGYWLDRTAVGHGYASAAAEALTLAALKLPDIDRVEIHCDEANVRSQRVPERLGYRLDRIEDVEAKAPAELGRSMIWVRRHSG